MQYGIPYNTTVTQASLESKFIDMKDTPNLVLMGRLWGIYYEDFTEN